MENHMPTLNQLEAVLPNLSTKDQEFATSLMVSVRKWGRPTEKQAHWLNVLYERAVAPAPAAATDIGSLGRINTMFDNAVVKHKAKKPAIHLDAGEEHPLRVYPAKASSVNAGMLYVKNDGTYLGKITPEGFYYPSRECSTAIVQKVRDTLRRFCDATEAEAKAFGKQTGRCMFCYKRLTDDKSGRSLEMGYGKRCSEKFGLAWG
jgi:hypothetical protein